jgi:pyridoxal phosphate enzyme (YggS family)
MPLSDIKDRVSAALAPAGRPADDVTLIAVSKVQPPDRVEAVLREGHRVFGENRVQEAQGRWPEFQERYDGIELAPDRTAADQQGPRRGRDVRRIHTVDRPKLANTLARLAQERGQSPEVFIQVNTGEEPQKAGCPPGDLDGFVAEVRALGLPLRGLMCIPPVEEEASLHFALLAKMAERNGLTGLSMGMSADFDKAIAFGATHVRVGSAIFGERAPHA